MKRLVIGATIAVVLASCSTQPKIDPKTWTCQSLIPQIIDMSKDKAVKILEIESPTEELNGITQISCSARAEMSNSGWLIKYGAHVSDGGQVILEYEQIR